LAVQAAAACALVLVTEIVTFCDEVEVLTVVIKTVMTVFVVVFCWSVVVTTAKVVLPLLTVTTGGVEVEVEVATVVEVMVVGTSVETTVEVMKRA
jgi:hypothetical protein